MTISKAEREARAQRARAAGNAKANAKPAPSKEIAKAPARAPQTRKAAERTPSQRNVTAAIEKVSKAAFDLQAVVSGMDLTHVQCRDFGHSWRPYSARWIASYNSYESQLICNRCKTIRTRFLSRTGALTNSNYDYADGYLVKGMGRLTGNDRDTIRLASILAVLSPDTAED